MKLDSLLHTIKDMNNSYIIQNPLLDGFTPDTMAKPTASIVMVDGEVVAFDAYKINGNNYFKLRDVAMMLSDTPAQFGVDWVHETVTIVTNQSYVPVGGEMDDAATSPKTASLSHTKIRINGAMTPVVAYKIDDNHFFKLRDLAQIVDFSVDWDVKSQAISIGTDEGYVMPQDASGVAINSYPFLMVGKTKGEIDEKLGKYSSKDSVLTYENGLGFSFVMGDGLSVGLGDVCDFVTGEAKDVITNFPSSLTMTEMEDIFGQMYANFSQTHGQWRLYANYGGSQIAFVCDENGTVRSDDAFYFSRDVAFKMQDMGQTHLGRWTYDGTESHWDSEKKEQVFRGNKATVYIDDMTKTTATISVEYTVHYDSGHSALADNVKLTSTDGVTYTGQTIDSLGNTCAITMEVAPTRVNLTSKATAYDPLAMMSMEFDYEFSR